MNILILDQSTQNLVVGFITFNISEYLSENLSENLNNLLKNLLKNYIEKIDSIAKEGHGGDIILKTIDEILHKNGCSKADMIIISHGPGFFNSLRLVSACAKSLGFAWNAPVFSFNSLWMLAQYQYLNNLENLNNLEENKKYPVYLDARMEQHYHACYQKNTAGDWLCDTEPCLVDTADLQQKNININFNVNFNINFNIDNWAQGITESLFELWIYTIKQTIKQRLEQSLKKSNNKLNEILNNKEIFKNNKNIKITEIINILNLQEYLHQNLEYVRNNVAKTTEQQKNNKINKIQQNNLNNLNNINDAGN